MSVLMWAVVALLAGLGVVWIGARRAQPSWEALPAGVDLPATLLQRLSWWTLGVGLVLSAGAAAVVAVNGPDRVYADDGVRLLFTVLVLAPIVVVGGVAAWVKQRAQGSAFDERDQAILARAPGAQGVALIVTLAVWVIGLTEHFHGAGAVPVFYLYLLFWSCLLVNLLALPVGVLAGYRRS